MNVRDVMNREVTAIDPDLPLTQALEKMRAVNALVAPVCEGHKLLGVLSEDDVQKRAVDKGLELERTTVRQTMTPGVISCREDQPVGEAAHLMKEEGISCLPVLDANGEVSGILTLEDMPSG